MKDIDALKTSQPPRAIINCQNGTSIVTILLKLSEIAKLEEDPNIIGGNVTSPLFPLEIPQNTKARMGK